MGWNTFGKYATPYKGNTLKHVFQNILPVGIMQRDSAPYVSGSDIKIPAFKVAIKDKAGSEGLIIASTDSEETVTPIAGDDHIIARFEYVVAVDQNPSLLSIDSTALLSTDIILANISTGPLTVDSVPDINRFDDAQQHMENRLAFITAVSDYTNTPPALVEGTRVLVKDSGTGAFLGHNYELAVVESGVWVFYEITLHTLVFNADGGGTAEYISGNTASGYTPIAANIAHNGLTGIDVDDITATYSHISGSALFQQILKSNFVSIVEYISATPPTPAADDKLYFIDSGATGDWSGHDYELAVDSALGWIFITLTTDTGILSKENSADKNDWKCYIAKSDPSGYYTILCATNSGSSTTYTNHKTQSGSIGTGSQLALSTIDMSDRADDKLFLTIQAHVQRFSGMSTREMHICQSLLMTEDFPDGGSGKRYFQQSFYGNYESTLLDFNLLIIVDYTLDTIDISLVDGQQADGGGPQFSDYVINADAHVYYN